MTDPTAANWLLLLLAGLAASETILRLPVAATLRRMVSSADSARRVLASRRISDHWKERALPAYALRIGLASARLLGFLALIAAAAALPGLGFSVGIAGWPGFLMQPAPLVLLFAVSAVYLWLRTRRGRV